MSARRLVQEAKICSNRMYGYLEDLREILFELTNDENIDINERYALYECLQALNEVDAGEIEAIKSLGASNWQLITKVIKNYKIFTFLYNL